jgi:hypothetical protein
MFEGTESYPFFTFPEYGVDTWPIEHDLCGLYNEEVTLNLIPVDTLDNIDYEIPTRQVSIP